MQKGHTAKRIVRGAGWCLQVLDPTMDTATSVFETYNVPMLQ